MDEKSLNSITFNISRPVRIMPLPRKSQYIKKKHPKKPWKNSRPFQKRSSSFFAWSFTFDACIHGHETMPQIVCRLQTVHCICKTIINQLGTNLNFKAAENSRLLKKTLDIRFPPSRTIDTPIHIYVSQSSKAALRKRNLYKITSVLHQTLS